MKCCYVCCMHDRVFFPFQDKAMQFNQKIHDLGVVQIQYLLFSVRIQNNIFVKEQDEGLAHIAEKVALESLIKISS